MRSLLYLYAVVATLGKWSAVGIAQNTSPVARGERVVAAPTPNLAGTWDAVTRSQGGIGTTVLLSPDSTFSLVLGAMVDMTYKIDGRNFTIFPDTNSKAVETQTLTFTDGHAVLSAYGCSRKLTRLDSLSTDSGLVGRWKSMHMTGVPAYEEYTADGQVRMRVPIRVQNGTFRIVGNSIVFHALATQSEDSVPFNLQGDTLTLSSGGAPHRYLRARPLIPFDVRQPADVQQPAKPDHMVCTR